MASDEPLPDRCGASVTTKLGLEVHDDVLDEVFTSEERLQSVVMERDGERDEKQPAYEDVREYMSQGFSVTQVNLTPSEASESEDRIVEVEIEDDDPWITHVETEREGYCERFPMDNGRCYVHGGPSTGPPEGSVNAMTHALYAKRSNYYEQLDEEEKAFVQAMADSWIENAPFDKDNFAKVTEVYRIAVDQHRLWNAHEELDNGLVSEQYEDIDMNNDKIMTKQENPANLAYDRLDRTTTNKLKELNCLDSPDSQQAEAVESLAEKFEAISGE